MDGFTRENPDPTLLWRNRVIDERDHVLELEASAWRLREGCPTASLPDRLKGYELSLEARRYGQFAEVLDALVSIASTRDLDCGYVLVALDRLVKFRESCRPNGPLQAIPPDLPLLTTGVYAREILRAAELLADHFGIDSTGFVHAQRVDDDATLTQLIQSQKALIRCVERWQSEQGRVTASQEPMPKSLLAGADESAGPALTENQSRVLRTMARFDPSQLLSSEMIADEMDAHVRLSEETVRKCVGKLIESLLAERPQGDKNGARLNNAGRKLAGKIAE
jgi:hypothetical protein